MSAAIVGAFKAQTGAAKEFNAELRGGRTEMREVGAYMSRRRALGHAMPWGPTAPPPTAVAGARGIGGAAGAFIAGGGGAAGGMGAASAILRGILDVERGNSATLMEIRNRLGLK